MYEMRGEQMEVNLQVTPLVIATQCCNKKESGEKLQVSV